MNLNEADKIKPDQQALVNKQLKDLLCQYLAENPQLSLNGLSKRCTASEPTLRRIKSGAVKTLPTFSTIISILTSLTKEKDLQKLVKMHSGPLGDYLSERLPAQLDEDEITFSIELNEELQDQVKYLIFKLASYKEGLSLALAPRLFGQLSESKIEEMLARGFLVLQNETLYAPQMRYYLNLDVFVRNFKSMADFINTDKLEQMNKRQPYPNLANYSESVSEEAYKKIHKIQTQSLKKIRKVIQEDRENDPEYTVPMFLLWALDTVDLPH